MITGPKASRDRLDNSSRHVSQNGTEAIWTDRDTVETRWNTKRITDRHFQSLVGQWKASGLANRHEFEGHESQ